MPKFNAGRTINAEAVLAENISAARRERGWSFDRLAAEMNRAGCPIQGSAIYRIEKGEPRRRITVDELVALGIVLGVGVSDLLIQRDAPPVVTRIIAFEVTGTEAEIDAAASRVIAAIEAAS